MTTVLDQFIETSGAKSQKALSDFQDLAVSLAADPNGTELKTIRAVCNAAEKTPEDLAAEVRKARGLLDCTDTIEQARQGIADLGPKVADFNAARAAFLAEADAVIATIARLEATRLQLGSQHGILRTAGEELATRGREAFSRLTRDRGRFTINVPAPLPGVPIPDSGIALQAAQDWGRRADVETMKVRHARFLPGQAHLAPASSPVPAAAAKPATPAAKKQDLPSPVPAASVPLIDAAAFANVDDDPILDPSALGNE